MQVQQRAIISRALLTSAVIMLVLAAMFWREQQSVATALIAVALVDGALGLWFERNQQ